MSKLPLELLPHTWTRNQRPPDRKGKPCRKVGRSQAQGMVRVQFQDGREFIVDPNGLAKRER